MNKKRSVFWLAFLASASASCGASVPSATVPDYIDVPVGAYIDTGFKPNQDTRVVMDVTVTGEDENWFGASDAKGGEWWKMGAFGAANDFAAKGVYTGWGNLGDSRGVPVAAGRHTLDFDKGLFKVDGAVHTKRAGQTFQLNTSLYLFASNLKGADVSIKSRSPRFHSCRIYDNGKLVRDYVPSYKGCEFGIRERESGAFFPGCGIGASAGAHWPPAWSQDELLRDWLEQDAGIAPGESFDRGGAAARLAKAFALHGIAKGADESWTAALDRYRAACAKRREARLRVLAGTRWVYCRHYVMGGSHYAYTEALSDAQNERTYLRIGSSLCMAEYNPGGLWRETALLTTKEGCFRDVDVSPDGKRVLYSFKASDRGDDFHLYEMELATRKVRQLTSGKGVADYEGCYLPDGRILFNSTRCMQIVDCWWTEVSNLYRCDADGANITRITYDQVHDNYPTLTWDGRVLYTRWEYNDRSQMYPQPLFSMNVDGTNPRAYYGGNSWFPTTLIHARAVPSSPLFFGICTGHHSLQPGELMRFDPREGREEAQGAWQLEPLRRAKARKVDADGQQCRVAAYPYPIDEGNVVLSFLPQGWKRNRDGQPNYRDNRAPFALYWTDVNGARELLVAQNGKVPCGRPVPVRARDLPNRSSVVPDEKAKTGVVAIRDVYVGDAMKGVPRGTVKSMRVVSIDYRPVGIGDNRNIGPGGGGLSCTPPALGNGTWGVKRVLGEVPVAEDGSVAVEVPCRTPIYFMLLDEKGRMVQSMRSWTTLQPGETASCVGCHEPLNRAPDFRNGSVEMGRALASLKKPPRGFSFPKDVQPILSRRCVSCHNPRKNAAIPDFTDAPASDARSKRIWSRAYVSLTCARQAGANADKHWTANPNDKDGYVNWIHSASVPTPIPPLVNGSRVSRLFTEKLDKGHAKGITEKEKRTLACWIDLGVPFCGDYEEGGAWDARERERWMYCTRKRARFAVDAGGAHPGEGAADPARR